MFSELSVLYDALSPILKLLTLEKTNEGVAPWSTIQPQREWRSRGVVSSFEEPEEGM